MSASEYDINHRERIQHIPYTVEESPDDDGEDAPADTRSSEAAGDGQPQPPLEPVRHYHVSHTEEHPARELSRCLEISPAIDLALKEVDY